MMKYRSGEEGAVAVIVAISLLLLMSVTALVIDIGFLRANRRSLAADVDSAALAGALYARELTVGAGACNQAAFEPLVRQRARDALDDQGDGALLVEDRFTLTCSGRYGKVTVAATDDQSFAFAPAAGNAAASNTFAESIAEFAPIVGAARARPLPLCIDGNDDYDTAYGAYQAGADSEEDSDVWLGTSSSGQVYKVQVDKDAFQSVCNPSKLASPGGFLWIDFDGNDPGPNGRPCPDPDDGSAADKELTNRLEDGYACQIFTHGYAGDAGSGHNCRPDLTPSWEDDGCPSGTGVGADDIKCIAGGAGCKTDHVCSADHGGGKTPEKNPELPWWPTSAKDCHSIWTLIIYDELMPETEGASTHPRFHPVGFVDVVPRWVESGGSEKYIALEFLPASEGEGVLGIPAVGDEHHRVLGVRLCGAENEDNCLA